LLRAAGFSLTGTTRSAEKAGALEALGITPLVAPDSAQLIGAMKKASHILVSIPPGEDGDPVLGQVGALDLPDLDWLGYLSTTGVYGDADGGWVYEDTPPAPADARSERRLAAEQGWQALSERTRIFRLAGIYGPGRSAFDKLADGTARRIVKPGQVFSRIHVDDIARTLMASMSQPGLAGPFNLADCEPAPQADVVAYAAQLMGVEPPPVEDYETAEMSPMLRSFYARSRRVSGEATRRQLGVELTYRSYRDGLDAIYADST
jgi:nucleoside-diphosphate-sugar epimerase